MSLFPLLTRHPFSGAIRPVTPALLAEVYLAPRPLPFSVQLAGIDTPWSASLEVAPLETQTAVERAFRRLMEASPTLRPDADLSRLPPSRARDHLEALLRIWRSLGDALPEDLWAIRHVLETDAYLEPLPIIDAPAPHASAVERALKARLIAHHGSLPHVELQPTHPGSLGHLQRTLLTATERRANDGSLAFYGLRDTAQQADFAAARAQALIAAGAAPQDIAVLLPGDPAHMVRAFAAAGVPLTGQTGAATRDIAGETLLHALLTLRPLAPTMARASLYASPLMPWPVGTGDLLAKELMAGHRRRAHETLTERGARLHSELRPVTSAAQLRVKLNMLADSLTDAPAMKAHVTALKARIRTVQIADPLDWEAMIRDAAPGAATSPDPLRHVEGVALMQANELPWRPVRHLIVAGFAEGAYPAPAPNDPFFLDSELSQIAAIGIDMTGRAAHLSRALDLFHRQLCAASETITFLQPYRAGNGTRLHPSTGLSLVARTVPAQVIDLQTTAAWPCAARGIVQRPTALTIPAAPIRLPHDLLRLRMSEDGAAIPQSPSRLETLLVSPLAWLLKETGAEDCAWEPDGLDIMTRGNIAHHVLEKLFPAGPVPEADTIASGVTAHLDDAIRANAAFMLAPAWALERETLHREILRAATNWRDLLAAEDATILATEIRLHGEAHGITIRGYADCIVRLGDGQMLIVDHKSSGTRTRRGRMEAGWDLQLGLYRDMLMRPIRSEGDGLDALQGSTPGVAYHLLRDSGVLHHGLSPRQSRMEAIGNDISEHALEQLAERLAEVGAGTIRLNSTADADFFAKTAKLTPYALQDNPLVAAFLTEPEE
ncbi:PD-(D/E)XK nuclease family protein [Falsirhodobacter xinxiangensis]|uniref:PD-(D/E)XK nuclease family protein n=1 Tax=Falsirhodobacter xinxiangensis TaxID=2530049 RepID=UPI0010A9B0DD|nr:PD-(D/E)XK nuclease family protein [Rhodobacter xinxiangensis]